MDLLLISAKDAKDLIYQTIVVVLIMSLISSFIWKKSNSKWDRAAIFFDVLKVTFYLVLAFLTLYLNYDSNSKKIYFSLDNKNLSFAEILVIMLSILEAIANVFSMIQRIKNIEKSIIDDIRDASNKITREEELKQTLKELANKKKQEEIEKKIQRVHLREQRLQLATKKRYKYK